MEFNSTIFMFLIFPIFIGIYYLVGKKIRNILLFIASILLFAFAEPIMVFALVASMSLNYVFGISLGKITKEKSRKVLLVVAILFNVTALFLVKYLSFGVNIVNTLFPFIHIKLARVFAMIGISFFTLQAISYLVDVYKGEVIPTKNFIKFGVYFSCFAQITAGPIVRYKDIQHELDNREVNIETFSSGLKRFLIGLCHKLTFATFFAEVSNIAFSSPVNNLGGGGLDRNNILYPSNLL